MNIKKNIKGFAFLLSFAPLAYILNLMAHKHPYLTENIYSSKIYPIISKISSDFINNIPFSVIEFVVIALIVLFVAFLSRLFYNLAKKRFATVKKTLINFIAIGLCVSSLTYSVFVVTCGLNYARPSYIQLIGFEKSMYDKTQLEELCYYLVQQCNSSREGLNSNTKSYQVFADYSNRSVQVYKEYENPMGVIKGESNRPKPVAFSKIMSYTGITGVFVPFTYESNFNKDVPNYIIPSTILHEIAHYKGFMREEDANFIAYMVGANSTEQDFVYSSNVMALGYSLNAYYSSATPEEYSRLIASLSPEVIGDMQAMSEYWKQFETPVVEVSQKINDSYLKINQQQSGIKSYGEMVDSLLIYYHEYIKTQ